MTARRRAALLVLLAGLLAVLIGLTFALRPPPADDTPRPPVVERLYPVGTPTPSGYHPGIVIVRDLFSGAGVTVTPIPGVVGSHIEIYWDDVQPSLAGTPDWSAVEARVAYLASQGRDAWLSLQFFETAWSTTDVLYLPAGAPTVSYNGYNASGTPCAEVAPDYGAAGFRSAYYDVATSMVATFGADSRVAGFALQMGASGEAMNVQNDSCTKRQYFETPVPCQEYIDAVELAATWLRAGTAKPITLASGIAMCYQSSYNEDRKATKKLFDDLNLTPTAGAAQYIGYRHNGLAPDSSRSTFSTPTPGYYGRLQYGYEHPDNGGVFFEPGSPYGFPTQVPTADRAGYADYMVLNGANAKADNLFLQKQWLDYISPRVLDVVTQTLGTDASDASLAWLWFRNAEFYKTIDSATVSYSGWSGPFAHLAAVVGVATPTTYCAPSVRATALAVGGATPPAVCSQELAAPAAPESRNALGYQSGSTVGIDIDDAWQYAGAVNRTYDFSLRYLDNNAGTIVVAWADTAGTESTHTITKANTGAWVTADWTGTAAFDDEYTTHDVEIRPSGAVAVLNSLVIDYAADVSTPTPTPSPAPSATPTRTRTPQPTATFVTATVTRTPTATPDWPNYNCPAITPAVDGVLGEWAAATPVVLDWASASVIQPATPQPAQTATASPTAPPATDLRGTLYCGWAGDVLYFAGAISDTLSVYPTYGAIAAGDAVRLTLDGRADGLADVRGDDHDLYISPAGRVLDFDSYPISTTIATVVYANNGWTFEVALDAQTLELGTLAPGTPFGLVWHLLDLDSAGGAPVALSDRKRRAVLP